MKVWVTKTYLEDNREFKNKENDDEPNLHCVNVFNNLIRRILISVFHLIKKCVASFMQLFAI